MLAGTVFAAAWAIANAVHLVNQSSGGLSWAAWLNLAAALFLLARPSSASRLALLAAAQVVETVWVSPTAPDHQILAFFVNLVILGTWLVRRDEQATDLVRRCAPAARWLLLVAYTAAAVAKWNHGFLDAASSCGSYLANNASFGLVERDSVPAELAVWSTLAIEASVPLLLLMPWTRRYGVALGLCFHFLVSVSPAVAVADFTFTLWALYLLFLPEGEVEAFGAKVRSATNGPVAAVLARGPRPVFAAGFLVGLWGLVRADSVFVPLLLWLFTAGGGAVLLVLALRVVLGSRGAPQPIGRPSAPALLAVLVLAGLVAGPYLGLGTSSRFTMFSGLRTEGPGTNHLFLPSLSLAEAQEEYVVVLDVAGESPLLEQAADHSAAVTTTQLARQLDNREVGGRFRLEDGSVAVVEVGRDHRLRHHEENWFLRKTQHYRAFAVPGVSDPGFCSN